VARSYQDFVQEALGRVKEIPPEDLLQKMRSSEGMILLDVREQDEFARGHLPGALLIPRGVLEGQATQMIRNPAAEVIVYCGSGMRSALAADVLQQMGFSNVASLAGGFRDWAQIGGPIQH
jgi:rhodanese-related sulfurtransferase